MTWLDMLYIICLPIPICTVLFLETTHIRKEVQLFLYVLGVIHEQM